MKRPLFIFFTFLALSFGSYAQLSVGTGFTRFHEGFRFSEGRSIFNKDKRELYVYDIMHVNSNFRYKQFRFNTGISLLNANRSLHYRDQYVNLSTDVVSSYESFTDLKFKYLGFSAGTDFIINTDAIDKKNRFEFSIGATLDLDIKIQDDESNFEYYNVGTGELGCSSNDPSDDGVCKYEDLIILSKNLFRPGLTAKTRYKFWNFYAEVGANISSYVGNIDPMITEADNAFASNNSSGSVRGPIRSLYRFKSFQIEGDNYKRTQGGRLNLGFSLALGYTFPRNEAKVNERKKIEKVDTDLNLTTNRSPIWGVSMNTSYELYFLISNSLLGSWQNKKHRVELGPKISINPDLIFNLGFNLNEIKPMPGLHLNYNYLQKSTKRNLLIFPYLNTSFSATSRTNKNVKIQVYNDFTYDDYYVDEKLGWQYFNFTLGYGISKYYSSNFFTSIKIGCSSTIERYTKETTSSNEWLSSKQTEWEFLNFPLPIPTNSFEMSLGYNFSRIKKKDEKTL